MLETFIKMKSKTNKKYQSILLIIFLGLLWIIFNQSGVITLVKLNNEKQRLISEIDILEKEEKFIKNNIDQLNNNLEYIEFLAYSKYQMVHKNERIYPHDKIYKIKDQKILTNP